MQESNSAIVIDNGSGMCKAGLSGDDAPMTSFNSIVGRFIIQQLMVGINKDVWVGDEAFSKGGVLKLRYPMEHGLVDNWEDMTKVWHHAIYNEVRRTPSEHPMLLIEASRNPKNQRQRSTEIMFETFDVPKFYLAQQGVVSLYSSGRSTGIVLSSGDGVTQAVPIYQGYPLPHAIERQNLAGRDLTQELKRMLNELGLYYSSSYQFQQARKMKEQVCYVALDFDSQSKNFSNNKTYELPDSHTITIETQRFRCPQVLFRPALMGRDMPGVHQILHKSIMRCDKDIREDLYKNIVLSGGTTVFPGFAERLNKELTKLAPIDTKIKIFSPEERKFLAWIGGSILSSLSTFQTMWITKEQYMQCGAQIVHKKCP